MTIYFISNNQILSGNTLLSFGASAGTINISSGDTVIVSSGGVAENISNMIGSMQIANFGTATSIQVGSGGVLTAFGSPAVTSNTTVLSGGKVIDPSLVDNNIGLTLSSGGLLFFSGSTSSQTNPVKVFNGAQIEFGGIPISGSIGSSISAGNTVFTFSGTASQHNTAVISGVWGYNSSTVGSGTSERTVITLTPLVCVGVATGQATVTATSEAVALTVGNATGSATVSALAEVPIFSDGTSVGTASANAHGVAATETVGTITADSTVTGFAQLFSPAVGSATAQAVANGIGAAKMPILFQGRLLLLDGEPLTILV